ncbi:hypothetical protein [Trichlorobacter lovleyi]|uniref:hypothetical protein n=1 Tax=Trichlorobacter lovleyi TaxID=313985 RepID=UPI003D0CF603
MDRKLFFRIIAVVFVVVETFSMVHGHLFNRLSLPTVLLFCVSLYLYPKAFLNKESAYLMVYFAVICLFALLGHTLVDRTYILANIFEPLACLAMLNVFLYNVDIRGLKIVTVTGLIIIVITSVATIPITIAFPNAVRSSVTFMLDDDYDSIRGLQKLGIASFGLVHSLPFIIPLIVYQIASGTKRAIRFCYVVFIAITFAMIFLSNVTTSLILATVALLASLSWLIKNKRAFFPLIFSALCLLLLLKNEAALAGLHLVQPFFEDTPTHDKIDEIIVSVSSQSAVGDVAARSEMYEISWQTFFDNPLLGNMDSGNLGGHAYFVDRLAAFGLVGNVFFFMFLYTTFRKIYLLLDHQVRPFFLLGVLLFLVLAFSKNIIGVENYLYLFVFLPGLGFLSRLEPHGITSAGPALPSKGSGPAIG